MRRIITLVAWSALGALATGMGCSNSTDEQGISAQATDDTSDGGGADCAEASANDDAGGGGGAIEFTTFVRQLIENETADNNFATTIDDKTFVDSENPSAFPPAFFDQ
ncbi:MAG: hypothetical protein ABIP39_11190 [Polyangiaceae bacterium]